MEFMEFDLESFQGQTIGSAYNILNKNYPSLKDTKMQAELIQSLYQRAKREERFPPEVFQFLQATNKVLKLAALDLIQTYQPEGAMKCLFEALEDENNLNTKQRILAIIDELEFKNSGYEPRNISVIGSIKKLR